MNLRGVLKVGDEVFVDVVDSEGVSIGGVLEFYSQEYVVTVGRKYITTERYGKTYKYDIETGIEITNSSERRKLYPSYNNFIASKYLQVIQKEIREVYPRHEMQSPQWYSLLDELQRLSDNLNW